MSAVPRRRPAAVTASGSNRRQITAIDKQNLARDVAGGGGAHEYHGSGKVTEFTEAAQRNPPQHVGLPLRVSVEDLGQVGAKAAWTDPVYADAARR